MNVNIAQIVIHPDDERASSAFLRDNGLQDALRIIWRVTGDALLAEQLLVPLAAAYADAPATLLLFPPGREGGELATRLAWRLGGSAACGISRCNLHERWITKASYGSALAATLAFSQFPLCVTPAPVSTLLSVDMLPALEEREVVAQPLNSGVRLIEAQTLPVPPLLSANVILATGQGACGEGFDALARELNAEPGYSRQRVMSGGCDEQRMLGVSGQTVAPEVCIIAGASGAAAFMAGVNQSRFIVAINTDPAAPVFAAADVGIVDDAQAVLEALVACRRASG
ncbi:FAD-binding protein [uncultured Pluralibacter sp.]|uniref:FAD-binding protein n=1 Tax=uncultured Pluralibacter sp. TaxID=1490864 RepID=UPI00260454CD|nr:FAD-binding protein [uncultured Pluralibacter sp.]